MRKVKRWRYYCEHCKKSGCSGFHIAKHERGCCRNPQRECGMCRVAESEQEPMAELIAALENGGGLERLKEIAQECPACIMAAILQWRVNHPAVLDIETGTHYFADFIEFDFKAACKVFWDNVNDARQPQW